MKAAVYTKYGSPDVVEVKEIEKPIPGDKEVLIKNYAATVNRTDCGFRLPDPFIVRFFSGLVRPKKNVLGTEFSGEIEAIGKDVKLFNVGDKVFGLTGGVRFGAHAEYLCVPEDGAILTKPSNMSFIEAAAVCDGLMLAYNSLKEIILRKGDKILINGATGSIGSAAVQLAKYYGAEVTATCNTKNIDLVKSLGAGEVIDYSKEDFTKINKTFNYIFDAVGKSTYFKCRRLLQHGGSYFSTDLGPGAQNPLLALWSKITGNKRVLFPLPVEKKEDIQFFKEIIEAGKYKAVIDRKYPIEQIVDAYKYVETGEKTGNVVIIIVKE